jgi:hypothetical protein
MFKFEIKQFTETYNKIETLFEETKLLEHSFPEQTTINEQLISKKYLDLKIIQEKFRQKWSTFNIKDCLLGISIMFLNILLLIILINTLSFSNEVSGIFFMNSILFRKFAVYGVIFLILNFTIGKMFKINFLWTFALLLNLDLIRNFLSFSLMEKIIKFSIKKEYVIYILSLLIPFSNSFVVNEAISYRYFLVAILYIEIYNKLCNLKFIYWKRVLLCVFCVLLIRFSFLFQTCREENMHKCTQYPFSIQLSKLSMNNLTYLTFLLTQFFVIFLIINKLRTHSCEKLNAMFFGQDFLLLIYNLIEFKINEIETSLLNKELVSNLKIFNIYLARCFFFVVFLNLYVSFKCSCNLNSKESLVNFSISLALLASLILNENKLSIWFLIFILNSYFKSVENFQNTS